MINPWFGISFVLIVLISLMAGLRWYKRRYSPHPELLRKLLHISMGLVALTFPWLFHERWPVLLLAAVTIPLMVALRRSARLKAQLGGVIDGVKREESLGEIYFPVGIAGLFILSGGEPLRYTIPILLLTLADAVAALIGVYYGRTHYTTAEGYKSAEGSLAFFIVAFFSAHVPLLLFSQVGRTETLLIALILGLLLMIIEAVAWLGLDNLFIPIGGFLLLNTFLEMSAGVLLGRLLLTLALVGFVLLWRNYANLHDDALLGAALVGYLSWTLADWRWFVGPLIVFISHVRLSSGLSWPMLFRLDKIRKQIVTSDNTTSQPLRYNIYGVISVASGGMFWLLLARLLNRPELFYPYTVTFAIQLAILTMVAARHTLVQPPADTSSSPLETTLGFAGNNPKPLTLVSAGVLRGWLWLFIPFMLIQGLIPQNIILAGLALPVVLIAVIAFYHFQQPAQGYYPNDSIRWLRQASCAILGSLIGLVPVYLLYTSI
jgi:phytol kinase